MAIITSRSGICPEKDGGALRFLYRNFLGRLILRVLISRPLSKLCGKFMDSRASRFLIKGFIEKNNIDLNEYENNNFKCFNDCFVRKIKPELRPLDAAEDSLISPCDGYLSAYPITGDEIIPVKQSVYSVSETQVFNVDVTSTSPEMAAKVANMIAEVAPEKIAALLMAVLSRLSILQRFPQQRAGLTIARKQ